MKNINIFISGLLLVTSSAVANNCGNTKTITAEEVMAAQDKWGEAIVAIGAARNHLNTAIKHIESLYGYNEGKVLFKPTRASKVQFRNTMLKALSYFITGEVAEDAGFALAPFTKVRFENHAITSDCDSALAMGNYYFTNTQGEELKVEYSFGYFRDKNGDIKINLHHSSLPFAGS